MFTKNTKIQLIIYSEHQKKSIFIVCKKKKGNVCCVLAFRMMKFYMMVCSLHAVLWSVKL